MTVIVLQGDAAHLPLPDESVDLIVTSPPYFNLRAYTDAGEVYAGQIGSEATPREYIDTLLTCTKDWIRILKPEGSLFVNLGDTYSSYQGVRKSHARDLTGERRGRGEGGVDIVGAPRVWGIPAKSLVGVPWRYALGCVDELGLILRRDIIWHKTSGMPESVTDRARSSHEYLFHLVKQPRYFSGVDEIREPHQPQSIARSRRNRFTPDRSQAGVGSPNTLNPADSCDPLGKLPGSVWSIPAQPLIVPESLGVDHYAAFPVDLVKPVILGWSPSGICTACGQGRRPVVDKRLADVSVSTRSKLARQGGRDGRPRVNDGLAAVGVPLPMGRTEATITGYACACPDSSAPARPATVVDPFLGTGTTALVADVHGRTGIGIEKSADYCRLATWRCSDPGERARALGVPRPPKQVNGQEALFD